MFAFAVAEKPEVPAMCHHPPLPLAQAEEMLTNEGCALFLTSGHQNGETSTHTPFAELHQLAKSLVFHSQIGYQFKPELYVKVLYMDAKSFYPVG